MTTNRMGLTHEQAANTFTDDELEGMINGDAPLSNAWRELLAYRKASKEPVADAVAWNKPGEERKCDIRWRRFDVAPGPLFAAPPLQAGTVPDEMTPEMMRAVQLNSELGAYAASNLCGAYDLFAEFWKVACRAVMLKSVTNEP